MDRDVGRAALLAVLACLCQAQSLQEAAAARQRESIAIQQETVARAFRRAEGPVSPEKEAGGSARTRDSMAVPSASLQMQVQSIERQTAALARQRAAWRPLGGPAAATGGAPGGVAMAVEPAAAQPPPDGLAADGGSPYELQRIAAAQQPRPAWPEPSAAVAMPACAPIPPRLLSPVFERAAAAYGLAPSLLRAVAEKESSFRPCAVSPAGALGLMQLMPETAGWLGVSDPFDVEQSVFGAARFLRFLLDRFDDDLGRALSAYNAGPARVESFGGIPPIAETQDYVTAIFRRLGIPAPEKKD